MDSRLLFHAALAFLVHKLQCQEENIKITCNQENMAFVSGDLTFDLISGMTGDLLMLFY